MVPSRNIEELCGRDHTCKLCPGARNHVLAADHHEGRDSDCGELLGSDLIPWSAHTGGKRLQVALRLLGKGPEAAGCVIYDIVDAGRLERLGDGTSPDHAPHHVDAKTREDHASHTLRVRHDKKGRDACAHRITHDVGTFDL